MPYADAVFISPDCWFEGWYWNGGTGIAGVNFDLYFGE